MADVEQWLADNYDALVADRNRHVTYESLAEHSDADLAAWARKRAAGAKRDVTPVEAKPAVKSVRGGK